MEKMNTFTGFSFAATKAAADFAGAVAATLSAAARAGLVPAPAMAYATVDQKRSMKG